MATKERVTAFTTVAGPRHGRAASRRLTEACESAGENSIVNLRNNESTFIRLQSLGAALPRFRFVGSVDDLVASIFNRTDEVNTAFAALSHCRLVPGAKPLEASESLYELARLHPQRAEQDLHAPLDDVD